VEKAQAILEEAGHVAGINESFLDTRQWLALLRRDYREVLRLLEEEEQQAKEDDLEERSAISLQRGQVQMLMGQGDLARRSYEAARVELEQLVRRSPDEAGFHVSLGKAYAGLGRRADAVREAKLGGLVDQAVIYTMVGQPGEAIAALEKRLSQSGFYTAHTLRLDPAWDPLRSDPRFQALVTKYAVKP